MQVRIAWKTFKLDSNVWDFLRPLKHLQKHLYPLMQRFYPGFVFEDKWTRLEKSPGSGSPSFEKIDSHMLVFIFQRAACDHGLVGKGKKLIEHNVGGLKN